MYALTRIDIQSAGQCGYAVRREDLEGGFMVGNMLRGLVKARLVD